jgi:hypothetical protein
MSHDDVPPTDPRRWRPPWLPPEEEYVPMIHLWFSRDADHATPTHISRSRGPEWEYRRAFPGELAICLRDAGGRELARGGTRMGMVHYVGAPTPSASGEVERLKSWSEFSGVYDGAVPDLPEGDELLIVEGDRVLWRARRPPRAPRIRDLRAAVVAAGDLDHPYARHYGPEAGMLHVRWADDAEGAHYEREVRWATPDRPEGGWTGDPAVGEPRGEAVVSLGSIPAGDVQVRVRLNDGFHVVESDPVVVRIPESRAVQPTHRAASA